MKRSMMILFVLGVVTLTSGATLAQDAPEEQRALRSRIEERFDAVPLTEGIALTPKTRGTPVRLIEIINGVISINGTVVTGKELRDRIGGDDADLVSRLSYLRPAQQRSLFSRSGSSSPPRAGKEGYDSPPLRSRSSGQRVRIFGDVLVQQDEQINGEAVAVLGSVRVDGEVRQEAVAVLGSVTLGPNAIVHGDVVSVGGRVRRSPGAEVRGGVTEISLGEAVHVGGIDFGPLDVPGLGLGSLPRLLGSTFRLFLLALFGGIALVIARGSVEGSAQRVSDNVPKAILVGLVAEVLVVPVFVLTAILLAVSIIGIPLLLLLPFAVLLLLLMAVAGFSGTAYAVGQGARRRLGMGGQAAFLDVCLGLAVILSPLLLGRMIALADWPANPLAWLLIAVGTGIEFFAWTAGFGAILTNAFSGWRARRAARGSTPVATA